jgi:hypothetical protein
MEFNTTLNTDNSTGKCGHTDSSTNNGDHTVKEAAVNTETSINNREHTGSTTDSHFLWNT